MLPHLIKLLPLAAISIGAGARADGLVLHQQAPEHGLTQFARESAGTRELVTKDGIDLNVNGGLMAQVQVSELERRVVLVHAMDWEDEECMEQSVAFLRDFVAANADRSIGVLSIAKKPASVDAATAAESYGIDWPLALVADSESSPYFDADTPSHDRLFVIGRGGGLAWQGDPVKEEKGLLSTLAEELAKYAAPAVGRPLDESLLDALESYHSNEWKKAESAAAKQLKKVAKKKDELSIQIAADAQHLIDTIDRHKREMVTSAKQFDRARAVLEFLEIQQAAEFGLPKTEVTREIEDMAKEALKGWSSLSFQDTKTWLEVRAERPVLYPGRRSKSGDRFDKKVDKFLRSTLNFITCRQRALYLQEVYSRANP